MSKYIVCRTLQATVGPIDDCTRPHQEDFGKGIPHVFFSGMYPYSRDMSVQAPYPYSVNDQLPDTGQSGSQRVSKRITRTLDFEESDTLDSLLNGNFCHKSMRGKLQRGSVWAKWPTSHILHVLEASRSSPSIFLGPSAPLQRKKCFIPSSVGSSILAHHAALWWSSPHRSHLPCLPSKSRSEFCTPTASSNRTPRGRS